MRSCPLLLVSLTSLALVSCGGSGTTGPTPPQQFTIGGKVSGLIGGVLQLQNNGGVNGTALSIKANGAFAFGTSVQSGNNYDVTVFSQPINPAQTCAVANGTGVATADVTNITITCALTTYSLSGTVTGLTGSGLILQGNGATDNNLLAVASNGSFTFPTPIDSGVAYSVVVFVQPANPSQDCVVSNGFGTANANVTNILIACADTTVGQWTWVGGADVEDKPGVYGSLGTSSPANIPGAREAPATWKDASGNFWLFGGDGLDSTNTGGVLNDLWKYTAGEWTWMGGSNLANQPGIYGTMGIFAPGNIPGARSDAIAWVDNAGNFWLFSGSLFLNDLWEYSGGQWAWMGGSSTDTVVAANYGTLGTPSPTNLPSGREDAVGWTDRAGNLWLFGGSDGWSIYFNDLWEYSNGEWTWMGGSDTINPTGSYGTLGVPSATNVPPPRADASAWIDTVGNFWLFGGMAGPAGYFNDLWKYSNGEWTWMGGSDTADAIGNFGTQGIASVTNMPSARNSASAWTDTAGDFWLFGGYGPNSRSGGWLNDLWEYKASEWTWISGGNTLNQPGTYGVQGTANPGNAPGGRLSAAGWTDGSGNLWLFGGNGNNADFNDLWEFKP
jgi:hypothetical protein